jgi:uncharacterized protein YlxW (UPF0749 family)
MEGVPPSSTPPATDAPPRRVDGSMSLLVDMMANTLDEAYAERAARRADGTSGPAAPDGTSPALGWGRRVTALAVLLALGVLTGTAVAQVRTRQSAATGLRADLAGEVRERTAETDALAASAEQLREEVAARQDELLGADTAGRAAADRLLALGLVSGTLPVRGPGVVVTVDDARADDVGGEGRLRGGTVVDGRVQDRDLQDVVNGLWAAGAEAVSINGQRLTALTAIRSAGDAVLVDFRPLSPPYVVQAIGDPATLELEFLDGPSGRRLATYASLYGLSFQVRRASELSLPGAGAPRLRVASPAGAGP